MFPFIINAGPVVIPTFFFMVMMGVLASTFYLYFKAPKMGFSQVMALDVGIVGAICGILGARIFHVFAEAFWFYKEDPMHFFEFWRGGFVSYGAYIGGVLGVLAYLKIRKFSVLKTADFIALSIPLLVICIRLGCIGAGCCYGKPTDFFIYMVFTNPYSDAGSKFAGQHLHPTQIYDLLNGIFVFFLIRWRYKRKKFDGEILLLLYMSYALIRGLIEFMRGDLDRGVYFHGAVSTGQITGGVIFLICLGLYVFLWKRSKAKNNVS